MLRRRTRAVGAACRHFLRTNDGACPVCITIFGTIADNLHALLALIHAALHRSDTEAKHKQKRRLPEEYLAVCSRVSLKPARFSFHADKHGFKIPLEDAKFLLHLHASHLQNHPLKFRFSFQFSAKRKTSTFRSLPATPSQSILYDKIPVHPKVPTIHAVGSPFL